MDLHISTITSISKLSTLINLDELYVKLQLDENITFIECGKKYKGELDTKNMKRRKNDTKKYFFNQLTIKYTPHKKKEEHPTELEIKDSLYYILNNLSKIFLKKHNLTKNNIDILKDINKKKIFKSLYRKNYEKYIENNDVLKKIVTYYYSKLKTINIKVFNNGSLQFTGLEYINQGLELTEVLLNKFIFINFVKPDINIKENNIVMINSDFNINYKINRTNLHNYIIKLGFYSSYEPTMYPGVNIKYYHNKTNNINGICNCNSVCNGKGRGCVEGDCRSITIAVFNSGNIIITGGRSLENCNTAYNFIKNILLENKYMFYEIDHLQYKSALIIKKHYENYKRNSYNY